MTSDLFNSSKIPAVSKTGTDNLHKVMTPMIRKILPGTIATDGLKVRLSSGHIYSMGVTYVMDRTVRLKIIKHQYYWNVRVQSNDHSRFDEVIAWLKNIPSDSYWTHQEDQWGDFYVNFYDEDSLLAFKLAWDNLQ